MALLIVCAIAVALLAYRLLSATGGSGAADRPPASRFGRNVRRLVSVVSTGALAIPMVALWLIPTTIASLYAYFILQP